MWAARHVRVAASSRHVLTSLGSNSLAATTSVSFSRSIASSSRNFALSEDRTSLPDPAHDVGMPSTPMRDRRTNGRQKKSNRSGRFSPYVEKFQQAIAEKRADVAWDSWCMLRKDGSLHAMDDANVQALIALVCEVKDKEMLETLWADLTFVKGFFLSDVCQKLVEVGEYKAMLDLVHSLLHQKDGGKMREKALHVVDDRHLHRILGFACIAAVKAFDSPCAALVQSLFPRDTTWNAIPFRFARSSKKLQLGLTRLSDQTPPEIVEAFAADEGKQELGRKVYRHLFVAAALSAMRMNRDIVKADSISFIFQQSIAHGQLEFIETALQVFEEAHKDWLQSSFTASDNPHCWSAVTWAVLFNSLIESHHLDLAQRAWTVYSTCKPPSIPVDNRVWNAFLSGYGTIRDWRGAARIWQLASNSESDPDTVLTTTMVGVLFKANQPLEAFLMFDELKARCAKRREAIPIQPMNVLLFGLCRIDRVDDAIRLVSQMAERKDPTLPTPNIVTLNTLLRAYGRHGTVDNITQTLQLMTALDVEPDKYTFTTIIDALSRLGYGSSMGSVLELMNASGVRPNATTLTAMFKHYLSPSPTGENLAHVLKLLHDMETRGPPPTAISYTAIISALLAKPDAASEMYRDREVSQPFRLDAVKDSLGKYELDLALFERCLPGHLLALSLFERMRLMGVDHNRKVYHELLVQLLDIRPAGLPGYEVDPTAFLLLVKGMTSIALHLFKEMEASSASDMRTLRILMHLPLHVDQKNLDGLDDECRRILDAVEYRLLSNGGEKEDMEEGGAAMHRQIGALRARLTSSRKRASVHEYLAAK